MRYPLLVALAPILVCAAFGQDPGHSSAKLLKDPRGLLTAALPVYDFKDPSLKPWHLKGKYQLYDENGKPTEQGTYEFWWTEPNVYRSTWSRPSGTRTEWHTKDMRTMYVASGARILDIERELRSLLVSAVPDISKLKPGQADIGKDELKIGKVTLPCAKVDWRRQKDGKWPTVPEVRAGSYCFESPSLFLRVHHIANAEYIEFDHLMKTQGRIIAGEITRSYGGKDLFKFALDEIKLIDSGDPAVKPTTDAKTCADESPQSSIATQGRLVKSVAPIYPDEAKSKRIRGSVLLDVMIGTDGRIKDMHLLASPSPLLAKSAEKAVAQWQYSPCMVDGQPQEVSTRVTVIFEISD